MNVVAILWEVLRQSGAFLFHSSPYLLFGFLAAGALHGFLSAEFVAAHLGRGRLGPVWKAALFGLPLPLCSCGVVPAAVSLRRKGATKGATVSFLISTPETGVDSIAFTYAVMGPVMAVCRPAAALFTAVLGGLAEVLFGEKDPAPAEMENRGPACSSQVLAQARPTLGAKLREGMAFAFGDLLADLVPWLALGVVLAGAIATFVPDGFIAENLGGGWTARFAMLAAGVPMYICATASTPIAAALLAKGLSPGAALVFLLSGPATNAASIAALSGTMGRAATARYLASIAAGTLLAGWALDAWFPATGIGLGTFTEGAAENLPVWAEVFSTAALCLLALRSFAPRLLKRGTNPSACGCAPAPGGS
jgi:uncharacterized membrane protein YraQ (UPF0718 family)